MMPWLAVRGLSRVILVGLVTFSVLASAASPQMPAPTVGNLRAEPPTGALPGNDGKPDSPGVGNPLWSIPLASLSVTRERPIFSPTRRRAPTVTSPIHALVATQHQLALVGAIAGDNEGIAIFLDGTTKVIIRLKTGESYEGWTLQTVRAREVVLQKEQKTEILGLPSVK